MKVINFDQKNFEDFLETQFNHLINKDDNCLLIGIKEGGMPLAQIALNNFQNKKINVKLIGVKCQRPSTKIKKKNQFTQSFIKCIFKITPVFFLNILRNVEYNILMNKQVDSSREVIISDTIDFSNYNKIFIIDDAVDSGYSLRSVINKIKEYTNAELYSLCVVVTNEKACILPDFYLHSNILIRFPWSLDG